MPDIYATPKNIKIGLTYQRPAPMMSRDEELIQSALLGLKPVGRWKNKILWLPVVAIVLFLFWRFV
jgi:hypothetical protein